jgi:hypothetical protein
MPGIPRLRTIYSLIRLRRAGYRIVRKHRADFLFLLRDSM